MEDLKASSREEALLAKIAGLDDPYAASIQPSSREEWFLNKIAEKTNSGGGGGGVLVVNATLDSSTGDAVCDKTAAEMYEAYLNGTVQIRMEMSPTPGVYTYVFDVITALKAPSGGSSTGEPTYSFICYTGSALTFDAVGGDSYPQGNM